MRRLKHPHVLRMEEAFDSNSHVDLVVRACSALFECHSPTSARSNSSTAASCLTPLSTTVAWPRPTACASCARCGQHSSNARCRVAARLTGASDSRSARLLAFADAAGGAPRSQGRKCACQVRWMCLLRALRPRALTQRPQQRPVVHQDCRFRFVQRDGGQGASRNLVRRVLRPRAVGRLTCARTRARVFLGVARPTTWHPKCCCAKATTSVSMCGRPVC